MGLAPLYIPGGRVRPGDRLVDDGGLVRAVIRRPDGIDAAVVKGDALRAAWVALDPARYYGLHRPARRN